MIRTNANRYAMPKWCRNRLDSDRRGSVVEQFPARFLNRGFGNLRASPNKADDGTHLIRLVTAFE